VVLKHKDASGKQRRTSENAHIMARTHNAKRGYECAFSARQGKSAEAGKTGKARGGIGALGDR